MCKMQGTYAQFLIGIRLFYLGLGWSAGYGVGLDMYIAFWNLVFCLQFPIMSDTNWSVQSDDK